MIDDKVDLELNMNYETSVIQQFYEGARIFITGSTGFLGNLLIQKLIRDCSDISRLYLLVRTKKGKSPEQRLDEIFKDPVFDRMKTEHPKFLEKIKLVPGDVELPNLGMNDEDIKMLIQDVNVIFHLAATLRFDEKIQKAAKINIRATKDLIHLAKNIPNLKAFLHVSTAYSHCPRREIDEKFYDMPMDADRLLEITEQLNDEEIDLLTPKWIGEWPNTYTYTKGLAENVIKKYATDLPLGIIRPSIIISTVKDPIEGWINNFYGPVGMSVAIAVGIMRVLRVNPTNRCELVTGDYVINAMLAAAQNVAATYTLKKNEKNNIAFDELDNENEVKIFNYNAINDNLTWAEYTRLAMKRSVKYTPSNMIWTPFVYLINSPFWYSILSFILEKVPAYLTDFILVAIGKKPMLVKIHEKVAKFGDTFNYFSTQTWKFKNDNVQTLWKMMNTADKRIFEFSMASFNWDKYFDGFGKGARVFLCKETLDTLPQTLRKAKFLKVVHYATVTVLASTLAFLFYKIMTLIL